MEGCSDQPAQSSRHHSAHPFVRAHPFEKNGRPRAQGARRGSDCGQDLIGCPGARREDNVSRRILSSAKANCEGVSPGGQRHRVPRGHSKPQPGRDPIGQAPPEGRIRRCYRDRGSGEQHIRDGRVGRCSPRSGHRIGARYRRDRGGDRPRYRDVLGFLCAPRVPHGCLLRL